MASPSLLDVLRADAERLKSIKRKPFPWYVVESLLFENGYQAVVLHRLAHFFKSRRIPVLGPLIARLSLVFTGTDIAPGAQIGPGLMIGHGNGLVIGDQVTIGKGALILHQVTIGALSVNRRGAMPQLGDDVCVGAGAKLIGGITIGDRVVVGANAVVDRDVPSDHRVMAAGGLTIEPRGA